MSNTSTQVQGKVSSVSRKEFKAQKKAAEKAAKKAELLEKVTIILSSFTSTKKVRFVRANSVKGVKKFVIPVALSFGVITGGMALAVLPKPTPASACDCVDTYTVKSGDTLSSIGRKYHVSASQLMSKNGFKSNRIYVNQKIIVPFLDKNGKIPNDDAPLEKGEIIHLIKKGETLNSISSKYGVPVSKLKADNYLETNSIIPGRNLIVKTGGNVPTKSVSTTTGKTATTKPVNTSGTYKVKAGDNLFRIAVKYRVSVQHLKDANHLKSDRIYINQVLKY